MALYATLGTKKLVKNVRKAVVATMSNAKPRVPQRLTRQDGLPLPDERQTVAQFLAHWLESTKPSLRPRTLQRYEELVRLHAIPTVGRVSLARLTPQHLQQAYADRLEHGLSSTSVRHLHALLHNAIDQAMRWGLVARDVADLVTAPKVRRHDICTLAPERARAFFSAATTDRFEALYVLALTTGMRQGELLALRWQHVDLDGGTVQVRGSLQRVGGHLAIVEPKTASSPRQVALTKTATEALRRHRVAQAEERLKLGPAWEDNDLIFANEVGRAIEVRNLMRRSFLPLLEQAGLPRIRFHDLRHTAATLLLGQGMHPKLVSEMLGHTSDQHHHRSLQPRNACHAPAGSPGDGRDPAPEVANLLGLASRLASNEVVALIDRFQISRISYELMARPEGFEPPTLGSEDRCSVR